MLYRHTGILFTTSVDIQFIHYRYQDEDAIISGLLSYLDSFNKVFNSYDRESELSYLNRFAFERDVGLSEDLLFVIERGLYYGELSSGAFDISIFPLIRLWKAEDRSDGSLPFDREIREVLSYVDYRNVELKGSSIRFLKDGMSLSLGGIAKGYIIDKGIQYLRGAGIEDALLNIGGDMRAMGRTISGKEWKIAIKSPRGNEGSYLGSVSFSDKSLATSGDYERYRIARSGERINHIIDPRTGYPVNGVIGVSVVSDSALVSDVLATTIFVLGPYEGLEFVEGLHGIDALIIFDKSAVFSSRRLSSSDILDNDIHFLATKGFVLNPISN